MATDRGDERPGRFAAQTWKKHENLQTLGKRGKNIWENLRVRPFETDPNSNSSCFEHVFRTFSGH